MNILNANLDELKHACKTNPDAALIFKQGDDTINAGYHITEIKHAKVNAIDCGQGTEQWDEVIIQLLDGSALYKGSAMRCAKFLKIVGAATDSLPLDESTQTYIEFSPNNGPLNKLTIDYIEQAESQVTVHLSQPTALCKPLQRAISAQKEKAINDQQSSTPATCCDIAG
ncbi:MAG: DUF6428 family protein [Leucothrix sp.]